MAASYTLADRPAIVKTKATNEWISTSIASVPINELFVLYRKTEVPIVDLYGNELTLSLHSYESEIARSSQTVNQWLASLGTRKLNTKSGFTDLTFSYVNYVPMNYHDTTVQGAKSGYHPSHEVAAGDYDDLIVNLNDYDPKYVFNYALFSVNGFVFPTKYQNYGVRLLNAGGTVRDSSKMEVGFMNFEKVGKIKQVPITKNMITKIDEGKTWFDKITIDTTTYIGNKTVGIVIGGYLHLLDGLVNVIGPNTLTLSMRNYNLKERVSNSISELDLTFMGYDQINNNIVVNDFYNEDNLISYLTSKYSFLVIIDNSEMGVSYDGVSSASMLGTYIIPEGNRLGRLVDHIGKGLDYWPNYEHGQWALKTSRFNVASDLHETNGWEKLTRINDAALGHKPTEELQVKMINYFGRDK